MKNSDLSCYVEFSFIDKDAVASRKIGDLMKKAETDINKKHKNIIMTIVPFEKANRFECKESAYPFGL
jgi:hypothetical protein